MRKLKYKSKYKLLRKEVDKWMLEENGYLFWEYKSSKGLLN
ncbi:hypothetical protein BN165_800045 [Clostridioides difficile E1]|nr:hypothetical protein BN165_800045 [Clostridioides difficile E1]